MRPGRAVMHAALPLVGLAALAVIGALRPAAPTAPAAMAPTAGGGVVDAVVHVRVVTDGRPQVITLPAVHPSLVVTSRARPAAPPAVVHQAARAVAVAAPRPATVAPAPKAKPTSAPQRATTAADAYPYANGSTTATDPWGFTERQCVSYVAWRLADEGRAIDNSSQGWGSALNWDEAAQRLGYAVSSTPTVGSVAQWDAHESSPFYSSGSSSANGSFVAGSYGHVGWVTKVYSDGSVQVAQYNGSGDASYSTMRTKAPRYLRL